MGPGHRRWRARRRGPGPAAVPRDRADRHHRRRAGRPAPDRDLAVAEGPAVRRGHRAARRQLAAGAGRAGRSGHVARLRRAHAVGPLTRRPGPGADRPAGEPDADDPVTPPTIADILPLSPLQEGLFFHARYDDAATDVYTVQLVLE